MPGHEHTIDASAHPPQTYLITGGAGFIGSHLADALLALGHRVLAIDDLSTGQMQNIQHLLRRPEFHFARASITDEIVMDRLASQADVIVHLAAAVGVRLIVEQPVHTIEMNVMGTEAVLKAALRYQTRVLVASTSEVYGKGLTVPFHEDDDVVLGPTSRNRWAYAASKMVDEFLALAYHREKGMPVVLFRLFNTVGPRQSGRYGMVIPRFVQQAVRGEPLTVYGDGLQSRCFLHVYDAIDAIIRLSTAPDAVGHLFNIGSTNETTILDLAHQIVQTVAETCPPPNPPPEPVEFVPYEHAYSAGFEDMQRRVPDLTRIRQAVGWQPRLSLDRILRDVLESMR
jgi:UDP-glucose 4-epimerase